MREGWKEIKLKEICKFKYGKNLPGKVRVLGNYPVYGSSGIVSYHKDYLLEGPGIIIGRKGTVGKVQYSKDNFFPIDTTFYIQEDKSKVDLKFLYYRLPISGLDKMNSDAAVPGLNRTAAINQKINLPPLPTQHRIAKILSAYDDLIENNLKRIKLLEEMAQSYFDNWYSKITDYEETNLGALIDHEIGRGWGKEEKSEEFSKPAFVIRGTDIDELPHGKIEKVPFRYHKKSNLASRRLQDGDIIFEVSGGSSYEGVAKTLFINDELLRQFDHPVMPASFCKLVRPMDRNYSNFLFHFLRFLRKREGTEVFEIRSASNIVNYNWTAFLKFQKVNKPTNHNLIELNKTVNPVYKEIYNLGIQNQRLKEARDILLPRLMTGMVDVEELEGQVKEKMEDKLTMAAENKVNYSKNRNI
ncbi:MAG: restriction endonuclease subunit S [Bacteroidota bacterium]|nr:restriction endonuclease subunit S [Bacteroidota bacterium]